MTARDGQNGAASPRRSSLALGLAEHTEFVAGLSLPAELLDYVADLVADRVADALQASSSPWLSVEDAAAYIAAPASRIYDLVQSGRLEHARDGRRLLFRREHLDGCLAAVTPARRGSGSGIAGRPAAVQASGQGRPPCR